MNGELASAAALVAHGTLWLSSENNQSPPDLLDSNSSFKFVRRVEFQVGRSGLLGRRRVVLGTAEWLAELKRDGVQKLHLVTDLPEAGSLPGHVADAFANGLGWAMLASGRHPTLWTCQWSVGDQAARDSRIWDLEARSVPAEGMQTPAAEIQVARERLTTALQEIKQFAEGSEFEDWVPWFERAIALLKDSNPVPPYHGDILPDATPVARRQLAAAAVQAWVFGGMGSWNDGMPVDESAQREYERVTPMLYEAVVNALVAAVNN